MAKPRLRRLTTDSMSGEEPKGKRKRTKLAEITKEISEKYVESSFNVDNIHNNMVLPVCANALVDVASSQRTLPLCEDVPRHSS